MQEKHVQSKDTDITGILVVALVLMVGVLIAKVAGDFSTKSTSTNTKAAPTRLSISCNRPTSTDADICAKIVAESDSYYDAKVSRVIAGANKGTCGDNSTYDVLGQWCTGAVSKDYPKQCVGSVCVDKPPHNLSCCVSSAEYTKMGTAFCNNFEEIYDDEGKLIDPKPDAKCKEACDSNDGYNKVMYYNSAGVGKPLNIQVPAPCKYVKEVGTKGKKMSSGKCCFKM